LFRPRTRFAHDSASFVLARCWLRALAFGVMAVYVLFFALFFRQTGPRDGDQFLVFHSLQYWNAEMFGIAKQWTPLMCSGLSMAGEPQVPFMSLSMALSYALGPLWGLKIATGIYLLVGWGGTYLYAGLWLKMNEQRVLAASLFIGNGFFACRLGYGHSDFVPFLILPMMLWILHRAIEVRPASPTTPKALNSARIVLSALFMGAAVSLAVDGSPVAIIHLLFWIGLYAATLSITVRSVLPAAVFGCAIAIAVILDAGYLWPMVESQAAFPRLTPDTFTSVFSLLWFALLPMRGKVLPANGNGHELSVFIGPILAYFIWRYRHWMSEHMPSALKRPLAVVSVASVILGMGSLKILHIPTWLSPFDLLRPLPGFRSIGVTGRYWGFLALPLSLLSAAALWKYASECHRDWRPHLCLGVVVTLQIAFQADTLGAQWLHSPRFRSVVPGDYFRHGDENIDYVAIQEDGLQGELIAPTRAVSNCYDMDDFRRVDITPGGYLVQQVTLNSPQPGPAPAMHAQFSTWSHIHMGIDCSTTADSSCSGVNSARTQVTLQQAYHALWKAPGCDTYSGVRGNLIVDCPASRLREGPIELQFDDPPVIWRQSSRCEPGNIGF
jgi:hypothetical protein